MKIENILGQKFIKDVSNLPALLLKWELVKEIPFR